MCRLEWLDLFGEIWLPPKPNVVQTVKNLSNKDHETDKSQARGQFLAENQKRGIIVRQGSGAMVALTP